MFDLLQNRITLPAPPSFEPGPDGKDAVGRARAASIEISLSEAAERAPLGRQSSNGLPPSTVTDRVSLRPVNIRELRGCSDRFVADVMSVSDVDLRTLEKCFDAQTEFESPGTRSVQPSPLLLRTTERGGGVFSSSRGRFGGSGRTDL